MSTYVLIHGDWHGGWCWSKVAPFLRQAEHRVLALDLPGHGQDMTPLSAITPEHPVQYLTQVLDSEVEPVILVGHSSGGMLITTLAHLRPEKVKRLVYLAAFLLPLGETPRALAQMDSESQLLSALSVDEQRGVVMIKPEAAREIFYADCTDEDATWAMRLLVPERLRTPVQGAVPSAPFLSQNVWEVVPRVYVECLQDKALGPKMQKKMYTELPCQKVYSLQTSHSPFLSAPSQLATCLLDAADL